MTLMGNPFLHFLKVYGIQSKDIEHLLSYFSSKTYKKDECIIKAGQICNHLYYIKKGLVKLSIYNEERAFIIQFFDEGFFTTIMDSFILQDASSYELRTLEDCELLLLHRDTYEQLCVENHSIDMLFRKMMQCVTADMLHRISERLSYTATLRYELFLEKYSNLTQRISLGDLANYLGITQASLSKIRAKK